MVSVPEVLTKEAVQEWLKMPGRGRGITFRDDFDYVAEKFGPEGVKKLEDYLASLGLAVKYRAIKTMDFYPIGQEAVVMLALQDVFHLSEEEWRDLGAASARYSFLLKLALNFISVSRLVKETPGLWRRHYSEGNLSTGLVDEEQGLAVARLENFNVHPYYCLALGAYMAATIKMVVKQPVESREIRCALNGEGSHEFLFRWKKPVSLGAFDQEAIKKLLSLKGEVRGVTLKADRNYVVEHFGRPGLLKLESFLADNGAAIRYDQVNPMAFYPIGRRAVSLLALQHVFKLSLPEIEKIGFQASRFSILIKIFAKHFISLERAAAQAPPIWKKHYTIGELSASVDGTKRTAAFNLVGLDIHPVFCRYLAGYFASVGQMVVGRPVAIEETECSFSGGLYHRYSLTW